MAMNTPSLVREPPELPRCGQPGSGLSNLRISNDNGRVVRARRHGYTRAPVRPSTLLKIGPCDLLEQVAHRQRRRLFGHSIVANYDHLRRFESLDYRRWSRI